MQSGARLLNFEKTVKTRRKLEDAPLYLIKFGILGVCFLNNNNNDGWEVGITRTLALPLVKYEKQFVGCVNFENYFMHIQLLWVRGSSFILCCEYNKCLRLLWCLNLLEKNKFPITYMGPFLNDALNTSNLYPETHFPFFV